MRLLGTLVFVIGVAIVSHASAQLTAADVQTVINQAASRAAAISPNSVIAVTDREGFVLGVWNVRGDGEPTDQEIATAVSKAGTASFLSSNQNAFTSRTAGFIIQQHFPAGVRNTSPGPLVGVGLSNLFSSDINKFKGPGSVTVFSPTPGLAITPVPFTSLDGSPGGLPLYKKGILVGGIGVTGDGVPGPFAGIRAENPFTFIGGGDVDEDVALAGQRGFGPPSSITADNVFINGIALAYVVSSTGKGAGVRGNPSTKYPVKDSPPPFPYPVGRFGGVKGQIRQPIINDPVPGTINGQPRLTAAEVERIINFGADRARTTRAGIRLPIGVPMQCFITVVNFPDQPGVNPTVLGAFRTGEATLFSWDVAVQKARTCVGFSDTNNRIALSTRAVGFLAQAHYPPGLDVQPPGPFYGLQEFFSGVPLKTGEPPRPPLMSKPDPRFPNGVTIFPGGFPLYRNGQLIGAIGISGDGVDQDDIVGASGTHDFLAPARIRSDQFGYLGARLPYAKFPRDPEL
jgi:uncharacterized protein GlcG (DUF336 family)